MVSLKGGLKKMNHKEAKENVVAQALRPKWKWDLGKDGGENMDQAGMRAITDEMRDMLGDTVATTTRVRSA